jgi:hypothetical protein
MAGRMRKVQVKRLGIRRYEKKELYWPPVVSPCKAPPVIGGELYNI